MYMYINIYIYIDAYLFGMIPLTTIFYGKSSHQLGEVGVYRRSVVSVLPMEPGPVTKGLIYHQQLGMTWVTGFQVMEVSKNEGLMTREFL